MSDLQKKKDYSAICRSKQKYDACVTRKKN